jgi:hypothetical protein
MKFINKLRFAFLVVFVIGPLVWAQQTTLPPLPIPDSVVVKNLNVKNTEIRDLLQGLAVQYGLNLFLASGEHFSDFLTKIGWFLTKNYKI